MKMGMIVAVVAGLAGGLYFMTGARDGGGGAVVAPVVALPPVTEAGYFKSPARDRVRAFWTPLPLSRDQAMALFSGQVKTDGAIFRGVAYSGDASQPPYDALTRARGVADALRVTAEPPHDDWDWIYMVNPAGEVTLRAGNGR